MMSHYDNDDDNQVDNFCFLSSGCTGCMLKVKKNASTSQLQKFADPSALDHCFALYFY